LDENVLTRRKFSDRLKCRCPAPCHSATVLQPDALIPLTGEINTDCAFVNVLTPGDLSSLQWIESPLKHFTSTDQPDHQLCRVHYAALNFRDVMLATGKLPPDAIPGRLPIMIFTVFTQWFISPLYSFIN